MKEGDFIRARLAGLDPDTERLFRINSGIGWQGTTIRHDADHIVLSNPRPLHAGPKGWPDLCGWEVIEVTPEMVGMRIAVFVGEEVKMTGDLSREQNLFGTLLRRMGGIFRVHRRPA